MKRSFLLTAASSFLFMAQAQALVTPDAMLSLNDCMAWAYGVDSSAAPHAQIRCQDLATCMQTQSVDKQSLVECQYIAETKFKESVGKLAYPGAMPKDYVETPVTTENADSTLYDKKPGKGWTNTDIGD